MKIQPAPLRAVLRLRVVLPLRAVLIGAALAASMIAHAQEPVTAPRPEVAPAQPTGGRELKSSASAQEEAGEPRADTSPAAEAAPAAAAGVPASGRSAGHATRTASQKAPVAADRVDLGTTTVTGEHEQPKVMYVVPWKKSDIGDLSGKPMNSLLDEALAPVDRDEFKREVVYYGAVKSAESGNGAPNKGAQGEK